MSVTLKLKRPEDMEDNPLKDAMAAVDAAAQQAQTELNTTTQYGQRHATASTPANAVREHTNALLQQLDDLIKDCKESTAKFEAEALELRKMLIDWSEAHAQRIQLYTDTAKAMEQLIRPVPRPD